MNLRVGYTVGRGTGKELADVFERAMIKIAAFHSIPIELCPSSRVYHSYFSLLEDYNDPKDIEEETLQDALHYEKYCRQQAAQGTIVTFKTAINAQSLYLVRQHLQAVKVECFDQGANSLLLVRDQSQGFYTGSNQHNATQGSVSRSCQFSKELTNRIITYSIDRAHQLWGEGAIASVSMVYKFHLFDGVFSAWAKEWSKEHGIKIAFVQPDTANRNLLAYGIRGRQLMIAGNEWADIMHVVLLNIFGQGAQETRCTENVYLHPDVYGLSEYQTVHGSADDIAGKGLVNPTATVRAAASILERYAGCKGIKADVELALMSLRRRNAVTQDQGGTKSTMEVVDSILDSVTTAPLPTFERGLSQPSCTGIHCAEERVSLGKKTAVIVLDFQNDFVSPKGIGAANGADLSAMTAPIANIPRVINFARAQGIEAIFVRFLGDPQYQLPNMVQRDRAQGKPPKCLEGTWGAQFHDSVQPIAGERIFTKQACFDAFLAEGFERHLVDRGYEHLIFTGVYSDVCVDATARTGFQKGFYVTVVEDCTTALHLRTEDSLACLSKTCGARLVMHDRLIEMEM
ncbi:isocitrate dehydrogenase [Usnea florida]